MDGLATHLAEEVSIGQTFQSVVSKMDLIGIAVDRDANLTYCNDYFLQLTGWLRHEAIGSNWFERFLPPGLEDLRDLHAEALMDLPNTWHHENEIVSRSGDRILINWNNAAIRNRAGYIIGIACIGENITERRFLEAKLLQRVSHERQMLSADLHDGLGQSLYCARLLLDGLKLSLQRGDPNALAEIEQLGAVLGDSLETCRKISQGLSPNILKEDLVEAFRALAGTSPLSSAVVEFSLDESAPLHLQGEAAEHLYGIGREAVTNARKHAQAKLIEVKLSIQEQWIMLHVTDDGIGLSSSSDGDGLGMKLLQYRVNMLHGKLMLQRRLPRGTTITCVCPNRP
jgi:PAS domain S-box-containing protein